MTTAFAFRPLLMITLCAALTACGGGGDASPDAEGASIGDITCDTTLFSGGVATPTEGQVAEFIGTYTGETGTFNDDFTVFTRTGEASLVLASDGSASYKGAAVEVKSACFEAGTGTLYLHWGTRTAVGDGAVYDNHVDLLGGSAFNGFINEEVFRDTLPE